MTVRQLISRLEELPNNYDVYLGYGSRIQDEVDKVMTLKNPHLDKWGEYGNVNIIILGGYDFELDGLKEV